MDFGIRNAERRDCSAMMELVRELAVFERAPNDVTVTLEHFEESGFGDTPVWWGFVATAPGSSEESAAAEISVTTQDPMLQKLMENVNEVASQKPEEVVPIFNAQPEEERSPIDQNIQLSEPVSPMLPESLGNPEVTTSGKGEKIVGFALYYVRYSTWKGRRMYLEDLYVTDAWRGKGIGTALMDALIGRAIADNFHGISWQVLEWNEPAITFYKRYNARFDKEWTNVAIDV